uniref:Major facilitator superfamily (MFS) profile domain-containing protein n=1 Tax=Accipiter nisus TaxID=211598 RepID=A0A8B9NBN1_9AVES
PSSSSAIFYYSTAIFEEAGLAQPAYATIGTGVINVAATVVLVERAGRRVLELVGLLGMMGCALTLTLALNLQSGGAPLSLVSVLAFVAFFEVGPGPIPWFVGAELFGQGPRPSAMALAALANWAANFLVAMAFPRALGSFVFLLFGGFLGVFALFTFLRVPETRGRPFAPGGGPALPPPRPPRLLQPPEKACTELQCLAGGEET